MRALVLIQRINIASLAGVLHVPGIAHIRFYSVRCADAGQRAFVAKLSINLIIAILPEARSRALS
jgi:hypothetical protein